MSMWRDDELDHPRLHHPHARTRDYAHNYPHGDIEDGDPGFGLTYYDVPDCCNLTPEQITPVRALTDGRHEGQGWWLEGQTVNTVIRWGYRRVAARQYIWGHEVDVIAVADRLGDYPRYPRLLIECKDYASDPVTPCDMWRLITLSLTTGCRPTLVHDTTLTSKAEQIARDWNVVTMTPLTLLSKSYVPSYSERLDIDPVTGDVRGPEPNPEFPEVLAGAEDYDHDRHIRPQYYDNAT